MLATCFMLGLIATFQLVTRVHLLARFKWVGSDTFYHLTLADLIRRIGSICLVNDRFTLPERVDYPPLVPLLSSLVPRSRDRVLQFVAPLTDTVTLVAVSLAAGHLWGLRGALVAALVYASTPYAFDMSFSFSPRPIAHLFLTLAMAVLFFADRSFIATLVVAGMVGLVYLTHRLTTQSLLILLTAYALFDPTESLKVVAGALIFAVALSRGYYLRSARGHVAFLLTLSKVSIERRFPLRNLIRAICGNPQAITVAVALVTVAPGSGQLAELSVGLAAVFLLSLVFPLGEGDRHFSSASGLVALYLAGACDSPLCGVLLTLGAAAGAVYILAKNIAYPRIARAGRGVVVTETVRRACCLIRQRQQIYGRRPLVLVHPQGLSYQVMYFAGARVVLGSGGSGTGLTYNRELRARLSEGGVEGLTPEETPDMVLTVGPDQNLGPNGAPLVGESWDEVFSSDGVRVWERAAFQSDAETLIASAAG